ncbi:MAG TPA: hypothetical protein PKC18_13565, partial [Lacipirellulaceae bacterium]|nr:hypothetical protein [Lacipirellulaceae bacterium]
MPYDFRDISATGTAIALSDDQSAYISLGFNFNYFGNDFSTVNVCSNGFLSFLSSAALYQAEPLPGAMVPNMIAGAWTDLDPALGGEIYVETLGVAPNREFVVMFDDVRHRLDYSDLDATPSTFEMILHETSNDIEFQYETLWQNKYVPGYTSNQMSIGFQ